MQGFNHKKAMPANVDDAGLQSAYSEADQHLWTKADLEAYEYARMRETDDKAEKMLVVEKAELSKQIEIAKKLVKRNLTNEEIAEDTGLTLEQIQELRAELNKINNCA